MTEKREAVMERLGKIMEGMSEEALDNLLLMGEGMVVMSNLMRKRNSQIPEASAAKRAG